MIEPFLIRAIIAGIGVAIITGAIGCFVVWRKMAYFGDSLAHSALLGVALGLVLGISTNLGTMIICSVFAILLIWLQQKKVLATDTLLGILAHAALSIGMVTLSLMERSIDLHSYLFGDILAVTNHEIFLIVFGGLVVLTFLFFNWSSFVLTTINEKLAKRQLQLGLITQEKFDALEIDREARAIRDEMIEIQGPEFKMTLDEIKAKLIENKNETYNFKEEFKKIAESAMDLNSQIGELAVNSINKLADGFVELAMTGKASFGELARSILADLQRMILKALFFKTLFALAPGLEKFLGFEKGGVVEKNAKGNVFAQNKVVPYKMGGIVDRPAIFPMANGAGLMGESGPEGILPLKRGKDGKLGVIAQGGGVGNISVNVDATGSSVESDSTQAAELGKMLGMAVQAELIRQKRPGGLLS